MLLLNLLQLILFQFSISLNICPHVFYFNVYSCCFRLGVFLSLDCDDVLLIVLDLSQLFTFYFQILIKFLKDGPEFNVFYLINGLLFIVVFLQQPLNQLQNSVNISEVKKMRKSCHQQNRKMLEAYELYQKGEYNQSLIIYQSILDKTSSPDLKYNLICTISVISATLGNYNYALELLEYNILSMKEVPVLVKIRYYANMCFLQVVLELYEQAIYTMTQIKELVIGADDHAQAMRFVLRLFFRVSSVQDISKQIQVQSNQNGLIQAFYMLNLAFAKDMCGFQGSEVLLKAAYPIFVSHKNMHLAVVCLRQLLLLPLSNKDVLKYEKQLGKIMSMDLMQEYQLDNVQPIQCCKLIAQQIILFSKQLNWENTQKDKSKQNNNVLWKIVLLYQNKKLIQNSSIAEQQRNTIAKNIQIMLKQSNELIICEMKKTDFYIASERQIESILVTTVKVWKNILNKEIQFVFKKIQSYAEKIKIKKTRNKSYSQYENKKSQKQNRAPSTLQRNISNKSLIDDGKKSMKVSTINLKVVQKDFTSKISLKVTYTLNQMIKFCQYGSFLSKRNFNSDGGQYRFVRVTQSVLKWAKNPQKIEQSCQLYPLKDINSIHYGKCTPTLLKQSNQLLKQEFCFSLRLQKRTLDFYCKDFDQVNNWVCGLTCKLKQINTKFRGYSVGKMLWKRMFIILKQNFTQKIRKHQRKFYYETAQAIILFGKNNYQLPNKDKKMLNL